METIEELNGQIKNLRECLKHVNSYIIVCEELTPCTFIIRNGDADYQLGDSFGDSKLIKIEAYGKELDILGCGLVAKITFDKPPKISRSIHA